MTGSDQPRFLVKAADGSELPVASLEELSLWVASGEIGPETRIFDQGTGQWCDASDSLVVRFIVDELAEEGSVPEAFRGTARWSHDPAALDDLGLIDFEVPEPEPSSIQPPAAEPSERPPRESELGLEDWMRAPAGTKETPARSTRTADPNDEPPWRAEENLAHRVASARSGSTGKGGAPSRHRRPLLLVALLCAVLLFVEHWPIGGTGVQDWLGSAYAGARAERGSFEPLVLPDLPDLEGLEPESHRVLAVVSGTIREAADSLRREIGLADAPPVGWLSGRYLGQASLLPSARVFWERYALFIDEMRQLDRDVYLGGVARGTQLVLESDSLLGEEDRLRLERHFQDRYELLAPLRAQRYEQLALAAERGIELHDFLLLNEDRIRYTPALGGAVPLDPVLEAGSNDPEVQRALLRHLDELLQALARSRAGGEPSRDGLRADLFIRLTES